MRGTHWLYIQCHVMPPEQSLMFLQDAICIVNCLILLCCNAHHRRPLQREALEDALRQLHLLEAIDVDGHITQLGKHMAHLPLEPALARTLLAANDLACLPEALTVVAMLSAESIFVGSRSASSSTACNCVTGEKAALHNGVWTRHPSGWREPNAASISFVLADAALRWSAC